jgi:hypothetical protein
MNSSTYRGIGENSLRFDQATLDRLRHRLPEFAQTLGIELRNNGTRLIGRCPVHSDSEPSFALYGEGHTKAGCYPCGFRGDVFAVSQWLGRSAAFPDAVADVARVLGVYLPPSPSETTTRPTTAPPRPAKQPAPPFVLSDAEREIVHAARLAFSDAFHSGEPIVDDIAASLGLDRETLRLASWGSSGLGLADGWLCYAYPQGLKWRNPDAAGKPRFRWIAGKALAPWRMEWVNTETRTVYVTEGESDTLAMIAAGLEADGTAACVASPGTSFPRDWAPLFRGKRVVLCFDTDHPGRTATATVAANLKGHASEILTWRGAKNCE